MGRDGTVKLQSAAEFLQYGSVRVVSAISRHPGVPAVMGREYLFLQLKKHKLLENFLVDDY